MVQQVEKLGPRMTIELSPWAHMVEGGQTPVHSCALCAYFPFQLPTDRQMSNEEL